MSDSFPKYREQKNLFANRKNYSEFRKKYPQYKEMSYKEYRNIIDEFTDLVMETVIENRDGVSLPNGLGSIFIGSCEKPNKTVRKNNSVYNNMDTEGRLMKIFYSPFISNFPLNNYFLWALKIGQKWTRVASKRFKTNYSMYIEIEKTRKLNYIYSKPRVDAYKVSEYYKEIDL